MLYIIDYELAAAALSAILLFIALTRRNTFIRSSRYFNLFCLVILVTSVSDAVSAYTISYPDTVPAWFNSLISAWYIFSEISAIILYILYIDSIAKIARIEKGLRRTARTIIALEAIFCFTTPWTHLVVHFDETLSYQHGPMFYVNYLLAAIALVLAVVIIEVGRVRFSSLQRVLLLIFTVGIVFATIYQVFYPKVLLGGFCMFVLANFMYIAFENPAYYYYKDTKCFNHDAFKRAVKYYTRNNEKISLVIGVIEDHAALSRTLRNTQKDNLLKVIADRLSHAFSYRSFLMDDKHFAVILTGGDEDLELERQVSKTMKDLFESPVKVSGRTLDVNISTAIIPSSFSFSSVDELEGVIDILISSSHTGEDAYAEVENAIKRKHRNDELEVIIEKAMHNNSFQVYYQPILNVETGRFESAEALVRLIDDEAGFVSPEEFIPFTEQAGLIIPLGEIVLRKVCNFLKKFDMGTMGLKCIEVNLSPVQCEKSDIGDDIFNIMEEYNTDPSMINFEITETAEAEFTTGSRIVENIIDMNSRGASFSVDDFGSGFSAMDHLFQVPVELVKVDKSILWEAMKNPNAMIVLKNTFRMIRELDKKILVEGVETQEMVDVLRENGCHYMQGYFFSKPIPENDFVRFLQENNIAS